MISLFGVLVLGLMITGIVSIVAVALLMGKYRRGGAKRQDWTLVSGVLLFALLGILLATSIRPVRAVLYTALDIGTPAPTSTETPGSPTRTATIASTPTMTATRTETPILPCSYIVTTTNDNGVGSLRQAMMCSNITPGRQTITFNIPGQGPHTVIPLSPLPPTTDPVIIDGFSQLGSRRNTNPVGAPINAKLMVEVNGSYLTAHGVDTYGLRFEGGNSILQGLIVDGFMDDGIQIGGGPGGDGVIVRGNFLGTDPTGTQARGNDDGIDADTGYNIIGGLNPQDRNLISGNGDDGVDIDDSEGITGTHNLIIGNYIGTNISGTTALGNAEDGVVLDPPDNQVGAGGPGGRNIISGNHDDGLQIKIVAHNTTVLNNCIGTDATCTGPMPNDDYSVTISTNNNTIGDEGAGNIIAYGTKDGIRIEEGTGNSILYNSVYSNGSTAADLGIDLNPNGTTPDDICDVDTGPNELQNFPVLNSVTSFGSSTAIWGSLNSMSNITYPVQFRVQFFSNPLCDASGYGEGKTYLGETIVTTNGACSAPFNAVVPVEVAAGESVAATATDPWGNTSEFSPCRVALTGRSLVGHVIWQGIPQNHERSMLPITITLKLGNTEVNYPRQSTDPSGFFTLPLGSLGNGTYNWRSQSPDGPAGGNGSISGFLAACGTVTLSGAAQTSMENGLMRGGDADNDNFVNASDFIMLKQDFGRYAPQRADFNNDTAVNSSDFNILKVNFGQTGCAALISP